MGILSRNKPLSDLITCTIETPQFRGSQDNFWMKKQTGSLNIKTLLFTPDSNPDNDKGEIKKHAVQFRSFADFENSRIK